MQSNHLPIYNVWRKLAGRMFALTILAATCGCNEYINPWTDEMVSYDYVTTASVEGVRAASQPLDSASRTFHPTLVSPQDGTVGHFPLGWEDPFEDRGSDDGQFALTGEDYFAMPYGYGRFILNTIAVPISVIVQPPVPLMGSDGITSRQALGYDHDAEWLPAGSSSTPPDVIEVGTIPTSDVEMESGKADSIEAQYVEPLE